MNDLSASSRITYGAMPLQPGVVRRIRGLSDKALAWLFITPTIVLLLAINIFPLVWTIYLSFTNYRANRANAPVKWLGIDWYQIILTDPDIWAAMQVTAHFVIWTVVIETVLGFGLAFLIDKKFRGHGMWTTIILLPMMLSPAVVGNFWTFLYQPQIGLFNYVVAFLTGRSASSFQMLGDVTLSPWAIVIVDAWMWTPYVMLICLAGLRSIPDYIYEAAEVDRASKWGVAVHHARRAVPRHRELQDVRHGQSAHRRRAGLDHGGRLDHTQARGLRELADRLFLGLRDHSVRDRVWPRQHLCEGAEPGEEPMSIANTAHSVVEPSSGTRRVAGSLVVLYAVITMIPLIWIVLTAFKSPDDAISYPPKVVFTPSLEGFCNLFTTRSRQTPEFIRTLGPPQGICDEIARSRNMVVAGPPSGRPCSRSRSARCRPMVSRDSTYP